MLLVISWIWFKTHVCCTLFAIQPSCYRYCLVALHEYLWPSKRLGRFSLSFGFQIIKFMKKNKSKYPRSMVKQKCAVLWIQKHSNYIPSKFHLCQLIMTRSGPVAGLTQTKITSSCNISWFFLDSFFTLWYLYPDNVLSVFTYNLSFRRSSSS